MPRQQVDPRIHEILDILEALNQHPDRVYPQKIKAFLVCLLTFFFFPRSLVFFIENLYLSPFHCFLLITLFILTTGIFIGNVSFLKFCRYLMLIFMLLAVFVAFVFASNEAIMNPKGTRYNVFESFENAKNAIVVFLSIVFFYLFAFQNCMITKLIEEIEAEAANQQVILLPNLARP